MNTEPANDAKLNVFDLGFSTQVDGPGLRMVVYLKGCNLHCPWCAAPESIAPERQVLFYPGRARAPEDLIAACPHGAVYLDGTRPRRHVKTCATCSEHACLETYNRAFERVGSTTTVQHIVTKAVRYRRFFGRRGGVTIGGGEPTCQFDPVSVLLQRLHKLQIHTALETNGTCERLPDLFPALDLLLIDLKHPDTTRCRALTGEGNQTVLRNIMRRHAQGGAMLVRITLIPGVNAQDDVLHHYGERLSAIGPLTCELIPFHRRGEPKWEALGRTTPIGSLRELPAERLETACRILLSHGLRAR